MYMALAILKVYIISIVLHDIATYIQCQKLFASIYNIAIATYSVLALINSCHIYHRVSSRKSKKHGEQQQTDTFSSNSKLFINATTSMNVIKEMC